MCRIDLLEMRIDILDIIYNLHQMTVYILLCHVIRFLLPRRVLRILRVNEYQSVFPNGHAIFNIPGPGLFGETPYAVYTYHIL